jgi:pyruvate/2-oxoacid:ferredoxin oxidoreductase beta subunit/Pyruvate/2-oxoacid:ferredoxin oxidoreductase gamma subunit
MTTFLNNQRPPVFCPGCAHEKVVKVLDEALQQLGLKAEQIVLVTDIGCSGLFDVFFHTHAMHGLHGRALTYATGLKMACSELTVITIMGDGGLGIGGAHVLSSCRRNLDITLLVLNNFNYGMTGGQYSVTTPADAVTGSGFLNQLEPPLDICRIAVAAGAPWVYGVTSEDEDLQAVVQAAIRYNGFSLLEISGLCTGRFTKRNRGAQKILDHIRDNDRVQGVVPENEREEFGDHYRRLAHQQHASASVSAVNVTAATLLQKRHEILILGAAGQRINTAGEILCLAAMVAGLHVTQKNDYPITVLRGHSVSEVVLSPEPILYTGITVPDVILALSAEGVGRRKEIFAQLNADALVIQAQDVAVPETGARVVKVDFRDTYKISSVNRPLASLAVLALESSLLTMEMLNAGLKQRLSGRALEESEALLQRFTSIYS